MPLWSRRYCCCLNSLPLWVYITRFGGSVWRDTIGTEFPLGSELTRCAWQWHRVRVFSSARFCFPRIADFAIFDICWSFLFGWVFCDTLYYLNRLDGWDRVFYSFHSIVYIIVLYPLVVLMALTGLIVSIRYGFDLWSDLVMWCDTSSLLYTIPIPRHKLVLCWIQYRKI